MTPKIFWLAMFSICLSVTAQFSFKAGMAGSTMGQKEGDLSILKTALLAVAMMASPAPVQAADTAKVGTCLLSSCQKELAGCLADGSCAQNLICLQTCNGRADETDCQVRLALAPRSSQQGQVV